MNYSIHSAKGMKIMSEELLHAVPQSIGKYTYLALGETTIRQLMESGYIPRRTYKGILRKKPDGIAFYQKSVKAIVEYKAPEKLRTDTDVQKAIDQEIAVAKALCKILIVTDGQRSYWINALNGEQIRDTKGNSINTVFDSLNVKNVNVLEYLIEEIDMSIDKNNSCIRSYRNVDPTPLASKLWQTIWAATGKSPVKCLYNVVELFIFKFLSDLNVLPQDISFSNVYEKTLTSPEEALDYYARNTRFRIKQLFPKGADGTTIINGTIFVDEAGNANLSQSYLFAYSLKHLQDYSEEFGSLTKISKQFKTKLYESFLKQEVEALGQYFTPRVIVQAVIRMAGLDDPTFSYRGKRICDPFCGVGGFLMELLNLNENIMAAFRPDASGTIEEGFVLNGFDKGFEKDDERTIIMAKANMLIYLAEILFQNPTCTQEFASLFNRTFTLFKDNLGTFGYVDPFTDESKQYDYILSNPPYVISGTKIIKEELRKTTKTKGKYTINAVGLESLGVEWIVNSLKPGGKAFVVIPDGILGRVVPGSKRLRQFILDKCYLDAIVSLPVRTFFANYEHTYIIALTKKDSPTLHQDFPVFTYLVSNIGERLTSVKREAIDDNDLPEMIRLFKIYNASRAVSKDYVEQASRRCKIFDFETFEKGDHWVIDRWWTEAEKIEIGIFEAPHSVTKDELEQAILDFQIALREYEAFAEKIEQGISKFTRKSLGDKKLFKLRIGKRVLKDNLIKHADSDLVPVFSANAIEPFGYISAPNRPPSAHNSILWGIDGNFNFNLIPKGRKYIITDHCGAIDILLDTILPDYLLYALQEEKRTNDFDRSFRASLTNIRKFQVRIPITADGSFDVDEQQRIATDYKELCRLKEQLNEAKTKMDDLLSHYTKL